MSPVPWSNNNCIGDSVWNNLSGRQSLRILHLDTVCQAIFTFIIHIVTSYGQVVQLQLFNEQLRETVFGCICGYSSKKVQSKTKK